MRIKPLSVFIGIFFFFFPHNLFLEPTAAYAAWTENIVDSTVDAQYMSLAIDQNGFVHVSYYDNNTAFQKDLKYAFFDGTTWNTVLVDSAGSVGKYSSLELDASGYAHISYLDEMAADLKYAWFNGTGWNISKTSYDRYDGYASSLALDLQGYAHISFYNDFGSGLVYSVFNGTGWTHTSLDDQANVLSEQTAIALNEQGYAQIVYVRDSGDLMYANFNGTGWSFTTVDSSRNFDQVSFVLDAQGYGRVSYRDTTANDLYYAAYNGTGWTMSLVDSAFATGYYSSLALDSRGYAYISYVTDESGTGSGAYNLNLAYFNGTGWELEVLYTSVSFWGGLPSNTSLQMYNDYVYLTYSHLGDLATTTNAPSGFVSEPTFDILGKMFFLGLPFAIFFRKNK